MAGVDEADVVVSIGAGATGAADSADFDFGDGGPAGAGDADGDGESDAVVDGTPDAPSANATAAVASTWEWVLVWPAGRADEIERTSRDELESCATEATNSDAATE